MSTPETRTERLLRAVVMAHPKTNKANGDAQSTIDYAKWLVFCTQLIEAELDSTESPSMSTPIVMLLLRLLPWVLKQHPEFFDESEKVVAERFLHELRGNR
jgi:hypothetical protein